MRLLHTADWHVGKTLHGRNRMDEYEAVLAEIVAVANNENVDLTIVAGDLFDSASPPPAAEALVYQTVLDLAKVSPVILIPGNHDSDRRLAAVAPLFELAGVHVRAFVGQDNPVYIEGKDGNTACVAILPWISQRHIVKAEQIMTSDAAGLSGHFAERMQRVIAHVTSAFSTDTVNVLAGHITLAGSSLGGGERTAQTIFDYWIEPGVFPANAHYVALGHIHKRQAMLGRCPIHYSGSPVQLDFSDHDGGKHVLIAEAAPGTPAEVREIPLASGKRLRTVHGTLAELREIATITRDDYLRIFVKEQARTGLGDEIRELFPNALKIVIEAERPERADAGARDRAVSPAQLFELYLGEKGVDDPALVSLFNELHEECST
ncbi:MAG: exonuclease SbcCD subunit D [Actinomycetota bacterium]|nr:exonuclease SbcCD subunit D [Actinomycetota bacterium]